MSSIFGRSIISSEPSLLPTGKGGETGGEREGKRGGRGGRRAQLSSDVERRAKGEERREERGESKKRHLNRPQKKTKEKVGTRDSGVGRGLVQPSTPRAWKLPDTPGRKASPEGHPSPPYSKGVLPWDSLLSSSLKNSPFDGRGGPEDDRGVCRHGPAPRGGQPGQGGRHLRQRQLPSRRGHLQPPLRAPAP